MSTITVTYRPIITGDVSISGTRIVVSHIVAYYPSGKGTVILAGGHRFDVLEPLDEIERQIRLIAGGDE